MKVDNNVVLEIGKQVACELQNELIELKIICKAQANEIAALKEKIEKQKEE